MAGESEVTQVQLTEDGSRPVDLPEQFKDVQAIASAFKEAQATITRLSQTPTETPPAEKPKETKKTMEAAEVNSALETIHRFNEEQRVVRQTESVGAVGLKALVSYLDGEAIDPAIKASYDAAIDSGSEALIDANFAMVKQAFEADNGAFETPENMVAGVAGGGVLIPTGTTPFRSLEEQLTAQRDPKYQTDPAFRMDVENRIAISPTYQA